MFKTILAVTIAITTLTYSTDFSRAEGTGQACGFWAFAGAFKDVQVAYNKQRRIGGSVWHLAGSDSPNAHLDLYVIAKGPSSRSQANAAKRQFQAKGVRDAYVARRCLVAG